MRNQQHERLLRDIAELRDLLAQCSFSSILETCHVYWFTERSTRFFPVELLSPARQWSYLLGLTLATDEPAEAREFSADDSRVAAEKLNAIFLAYAWSYFPASDEDVTEDWMRTREVAMPAFLDYFNQGILASAQQIEGRIKQYLAPFDEQLAAGLGVSASQAAAIARWISDQLQDSADSLAAQAGREREARLALLDRMQREGWSLERLRQEARESDYSEHASRLFAGMSSVAEVRRTVMENHFGAGEAGAFWTLFSIARGEVEQLTYPTEFNPVSERSIYRIDEDRAICPLANQLFLAVLTRMERHLAEGPTREAFFRQRDRILEREVEAQFRRLFGESARFYSTVFETPDRQFEHDLAVVFGRSLLVVEAKASPPVEPFRDPERAFTRIRHAFRSDRGIQKAFDQANRIRAGWTSGEPVRLYDAAGSICVELNQASIDDVFLVCATRDNFGFIAVEPSILLDKQQKEPAPWCVNVLDLETIADAWDHLGWSGDRLIQFLEQRRALYGRLLGSDELDVMGFFMRHGGLHWITESGADRFQLDPAYSSVFDEIYRARMGAGPPLELTPTEPVLSDLRESLRRGQPVPFEPPARTRAAGRQPRNAPCACGSGLKYKRCCGR